MKGLCILGSTGSIGVSTLDVVARHPEYYRVVALTAHRQLHALYEQCARFQPDYAVMTDEASAYALKDKLTTAGLQKTKVLSGVESLEQVATLSEVDAVMAAIVGAAGLLPTLAAAEAGKTLLLANKEALVMSGPLFMAAVARSGAHLLPIDSEHNAIFQCMPAGYRAGHRPSEVRRILLTASGGPFLHRSLSDLEEVTPDEAVAHPNWVMGRKISVDSATMMNKGLELIEACLLFQMAPERIQIVIHRQSVIHSLVDYVDGTVLAQMGNPDMRIPIAYALAWPGRFDSGVEPLDLFSVKQLDFAPPDMQRFPCLQWAYEAAAEGGTKPAILNAANEVAVAYFLDGKIRFPTIADTIGHCMENTSAGVADSITVILEADREARSVARDYLAQRQIA